MDRYIGGSFLSGCLTSFDYWLNVLPLGVGDLFVVWWMLFIEVSWRSHLFGENPIKDV